MPCCSLIYLSSLKFTFYAMSYTVKHTLRGRVAKLGKETGFLIFFEHIRGRSFIDKRIFCLEIVCAKSFFLIN
jgi:hypothetical protein